MKQWLFDQIHQRNLIYNQCWEDPTVDKQALSITSADRIVMITSAGCNALDYLLSSPQRIDCVDLNPYQTALLELKLAAVPLLGVPADQVRQIHDTAADGTQALRIALERHPALAILDWRMPGLDGLEVAHQIRTSPAIADVPIILVSAMEIPADKSLIDRLKLYAYIPKPMDLAALKGCVQSALSR